MSNAFKHFSGNETLEVIPVASGTVIDVGDHVMLSGGKVVRVASAGNNLTFIGYAKEAHRATDPSGGILVATPNLSELCMVELDAATDVVWGDELQLSGVQKLKKSDTDPVAVAAESKLAATSILCKYKIPDNGDFGNVGDAS